MMDEKIINEKFHKYEKMLSKSNISVYEYYPATDTAVKLDASLNVVRKISPYMNEINSERWLDLQEQSRYVQFLRGMSNGNIEIQYADDDGHMTLKSIRKLYMVDETTGEEYLLITKKDVTKQKNTERKYREQAQRDSMTKLYNRVSGREIVESYLDRKNPYESCGMLVMDVDYFKGVNDSYGHLFGDKVLIKISQLLMDHFDKKAVVSRVGGDEFVVFFYDIDNNQLVSRIGGFFDDIKTLTFAENDYIPTCSIGVCFVPKNASNCSYDQIFQNADWALYQAKKRGRNRYVFCDNMHRYNEEIMEAGQKEAAKQQLDARYFQNDILATAFEVFEKHRYFDDAIKQLLQIIGIRFQLDRISVVDIDIRNNIASCSYQWRANGVKAALEKPQCYKREDFQKFFSKYNAFNALVINDENVNEYSVEGQRLVMQNNTRTVLHIARYDEGRYAGTVAFVTCNKNRFWSLDKMHELSEVVKLFSVYRRKSLGVNKYDCGCGWYNDYDDLTGLISFARFKEDVEHIIVSGTRQDSVMVYSDIENFSEYNRKYGFEQGDRLLKEFAQYIIGTMQKVENTYFARIVSDQFVLFMPYDISVNDIEYKVQRINDSFIRTYMGDDDGIKINIRTGIYKVTGACSGVSAAIDAANSARKHIKPSDELKVVIYNESMA
ncbi:GGDEF domain-containing protein [Agathobacter sp.]|uniref:GGDEF domain-containing protein n=2 Tax=Agathobacter TaxID=1766253 RepID=UPI002A9136DB|nr:GGDEF domain-containing protein [Agathobacter sp.]MDY5862243.1 GGDEF domain-containing protein [Agathobacter sp.]